MMDLKNDEIEQVAGGSGALGVLIAVIKYEKQITEAVNGFFDGLIEAQSRHQ